MSNALAGVLSYNVKRKKNFLLFLTWTYFTVDVQTLYIGHVPVFYRIIYYIVTVLQFVLY